MAGLTLFNDLYTSVTINLRFRVWISTVLQSINKSSYWLYVPSVNARSAL